jgi:hypothetical protein
MLIKFWSHLACLVVGAIVGIWLGVVGTATTYRLEIVYPSAPDHVLDVTKMIGKRSQPGKLAPETEHWQAVRAVLEGKTNLNIQRGPEDPQYRWKQQRLLEEQELGK